VAERCADGCSPVATNQAGRAARKRWRRLIRRTAEIRDATLALRCYVPADTAADSRRRLAALGLRGTTLDAAAEACMGSSARLGAVRFSSVELRTLAACGGQVALLLRPAVYERTRPAGSWSEPTAASRSSGD
jgi:hypothetical protein